MSSTIGDARWKRRDRRFAIILIGECCGHTFVFSVDGLDETNDGEKLMINMGRDALRLSLLVEEEFVNDLEVRPGKLKDGFIFFRIVSVACRVDRRGYGTEEVGGKLTQNYIECCAKGK